jgi:hypothetical protein
MRSSIHVRAVHRHSFGRRADRVARSPAGPRPPRPRSERRRARRARQASPCSAAGPARRRVPLLPVRTAGGRGARRQHLRWSLRSARAARDGGSPRMSARLKTGPLRRQHFVRDKSIKQLARETGLSRNTVRAALRSKKPPGYRAHRRGRYWIRSRTRSTGCCARSRRFQRSGSVSCLSRWAAARARRSSMAACARSGRCSHRRRGRVRARSGDRARSASWTSGSRARRSLILLRRAQTRTIARGDQALANRFRRSRSSTVVSAPWLSSEPRTHRGCQLPATSIR